MAYKSKFLHFKTKASYEAERAKTTAGSEERKVFDAYISFIDEGPTICTWGKEYQCDANSLSLLPQEVTTEKQNQALDNIGLNFMVIDVTEGKAVLTAEQETQLLSSKGVILKGDGLGAFGSRLFIPHNVALQIVYFYSILTESDLAYITYTKATKTIEYKGSIGISDRVALHKTAESLSVEQQNQVFKNLGWNVHVISQSDINGTTSPDASEKAKRLEATALLVKETSLIYVRGRNDSANSYFFKTDSSTQIDVLRINTTTGIIYPTSTQFIDTGAIRYDRTQQLSNPQKQQARDNIGAISQAEVEALDLGLTEKDLTSIDSDRVKLVSSGTVDKSFPYPELILSSNDIPDIKTSKTFNTSLLGDKLISTIDGKEVVSSKILLVIDYSGSSSQIFLYRVENAIEVTEGVDYTLYYQGLDSQYVLAIPFPNMVLGSTMTLYYNDISIPSPSSNPPKALGTANAGTSWFYSRWDHIHPIQESVAKLTTPRTIALTGAVSGSTTFDGSSNVSINSTLANIDASKITSGTLNADRLPEIPISKIPAAAMERLYVVESQSAAMSLTIQEGDVVQIGSGGPMYFCVSESASTFATKFKVFTAGAATSVPWSGVTNAPTKLSQFTNDSGFTTNKGTVTSVAMSVPTGLSISGSPITASGTLALSYTSGYSIPTTAKQTNWDTAYGWGNHASAGYAKATQLANYLPLTGGALTGTLTVPNITINGNNINEIVKNSDDPSLTWTEAVTDNKRIPTIAKLAYWNGAYKDTTSNLQYCSSGEIASKTWVQGRGYLTSVPAQTWASITGKPSTFTPSVHTQAYTTLTGSTTTANQAIVSNGTANGWTLKTLGSLAFSSATIPTKTSQLTNDSGFLTSVPVATSSAYGGIQIGYTTSGKNYAVQLSNGKAYVNVPWTDTNTTYTSGTNISISGTTINCTYTLPTATGSVLGGIKVGSNITLSSGTISLSKSNVTSALGYTPSSPLIQTGTITNNTITAGYAYDVSSAVVNMVSGFSESNPDAVVATASKITSFPSECSVMDGIMDLNGSVYVYCFTYIGGTVYINGAVYA